MVPSADPLYFMIKVGRMNEVTPVAVTIAMLTYRRPAEVIGGLPLIIDQATAVNQGGLRLAGENAGITEADQGSPVTTFRVEVLVVDNDQAGSARGTVETIVTKTAGASVSGSPLVRYVMERAPGISAARNRAMDEAAGSSLLVFIDDDERPLPNWLASLLDTWDRHRAAAVSGLVISIFERELDPWISAGEFFRRFSMPTGTAIDVAAAGNLLLDLNQVRRWGTRFENAFGLSGGEDTLFSRTLVNHGARMVWCEESRATESVPTDRMTRDWVRKRSRSHGNSVALIDARLARTSRAVVEVRAWNLGRGGARMVLGGARYLAGLVLRSDRHQARGMRILWRGTGMVSGALGLIYQEYARGNDRRWQFARQPPRGKVANTNADHSSLPDGGQP